MRSRQANLASFVAGLALVVAAGAAVKVGVAVPKASPSRSLALVSTGASVPAHGPVLGSAKPLSPAQINPPDVDNPVGPNGVVEFYADRDAAEADGFVMDTMEDDHELEPSREIVGREFVAAIGRTVGREMPLNFSYDLMDLTGSGFNSLILWPRISQLFPADRSTGEPVYVYDFDGKKWHLALSSDAVMLGVRPQFAPDGKPTGAMDLAMVQGQGYRRFVYDKDKDEWREAPKR